jgi:hypothetical protein
VKLPTTLGPDGVHSPQARAQVRDGVLFAWYQGPGSPSGAVLEIEPVPLADLQRHSGYDQDSESPG